MHQGKASPFRERIGYVQEFLSSAPFSTNRMTQLARQARHFPKHPLKRPGDDIALGGFAGGLVASVNVMCGGFQPSSVNKSGGRRNQFSQTSTCLEPHAEQWNLPFTSGNGVIGPTSGQPAPRHRDGSFGMRQSVRPDRPPNRQGFAVGSPLGNGNAEPSMSRRYKAREMVMRLPQSRSSTPALTSRVRTLAALHRHRTARSSSEAPVW